MKKTSPADFDYRQLSVSISQVCIWGMGGSQNVAGTFCDFTPADSNSVHTCGSLALGKIPNLRRVRGKEAGMDGEMVRRGGRDGMERERER